MTDDSPIRMLFATDEDGQPKLAESFAMLLEHVAQRTVTLVHFEDLADLAADARQFGCDVIFIWCNGSVSDREWIGMRHRHDYVPRAEQLRSEFPTVPVILVSSHWDDLTDFDERGVKAGVDLLPTPMSFESFKCCVEKFIPKASASARLGGGL